MLVFSGFVAGWSRNELIEGNKNIRLILLFIRIRCGVVFFLIQIYEYKCNNFCIRDGRYGSTFYILTGLHGLHVVCGLLSLIVQWFRIYNRRLSFLSRRLGLKLSILYWHFVDLVWVVLFLGVYVWPYECGIRATLI